LEPIICAGRIFPNMAVATAPAGGQAIRCIEEFRCAQLSLSSALVHRADDAAGQKVDVASPPSWSRALRSISRDPKPRCTGAVTCGPPASVQISRNWRPSASSVTSPVHRDGSAIVRQRAIFGGVGRDLVQDHRQHHRQPRRQRHLRSEHPHPVRIVEQIGIEHPCDDVLQFGALPLLLTQQIMRLGERAEPSSNFSRSARLALRKVWVAIDCKIASVFLTRWFSSSIRRSAASRRARSPCHPHRKGKPDQQQHASDHAGDRELRHNGATSEVSAIPQRRSSRSARKRAMLVIRGAPSSDTVAKVVSGYGTSPHKARAKRAGRSWPAGSAPARN